MNQWLGHRRKEQENYDESELSERGCPVGSSRWWSVSLLQRPNVEFAVVGRGGDRREPWAFALSSRR
jgi:hypothetical protein